MRHLRGDEHAFARSQLELLSVQLKIQFALQDQRNLLFGMMVERDDRALLQLHHIDHHFFQSHRQSEDPLRHFQRLVII